MADYTKYINKAYSEIQKKGTVICVLKFDTDYTNYDPTKGFTVNEINTSLLDTFMLSCPSSNNNLISGYLICCNYALFTSKKKTLPGGETVNEDGLMIPALNCVFEPSEGCKIYYNNKLFEIDYLTTLAPGGEDIFYKVYLKK